MVNGTTSAGQFVTKKEFVKDAETGDVLERTVLVDVSTGREIKRTEFLTPSGLTEQQAIQQQTQRFRQELQRREQEQIAEEARRVARGRVIEEEGVIGAKLVFPPSVKRGFVQEPFELPTVAREERARPFFRPTGPITQEETIQVAQAAAVAGRREFERRVEAGEVPPEREAETLEEVGGAAAVSALTSFLLTRGTQVVGGAAPAIVSGVGTAIAAPLTFGLISTEVARLQLNAASFAENRKEEIRRATGQQLRTLSKNSLAIGKETLDELGRRIILASRLKTIPTFETPTFLKGVEPIAQPVAKFFVELSEGIREKPLTSAAFVVGGLAGSSLAASKADIKLVNEIGSRIKTFTKKIVRVAKRPQVRGKPPIKIRVPITSRVTTQEVNQFFADTSEFARLQAESQVRVQFLPQARKRIFTFQDIVTRFTDETGKAVKAGQRTLQLQLTQQKAKQVLDVSALLKQAQQAAKEQVKSQVQLRNLQIMQQAQVASLGILTVTQKAQMQRQATALKQKTGLKKSELQLLKLTQTQVQKQLQDQSLGTIQIQKEITIQRRGLKQLQLPLQQQVQKQAQKQQQQQVQAIAQLQVQAQQALPKLTSLFPFLKLPRPPVRRPARPRRPRRIRRRRVPSLVGIRTGLTTADIARSVDIRFPTRGFIEGLSPEGRRLLGLPPLKRKRKRKIKRVVKRKVRKRKRKRRKRRR